MGVLFKLQLTQRTSTLPMGLGEADTLTAGGDCMFFLNCGYLLIECIQNIPLQQMFCGTKYIEKGFNCSDNVSFREMMG